MSIDDDIIIRDLRRVINDRGVAYNHREAVRRAIARIEGGESTVVPEEKTPTDPAAIERRELAYLEMRGIDID